MSVLDDVLAAIDQETTAIANRVQGLIDQVAQLTGSGATTVQAVAQQLQPYVDHLKAIAADPSNPVPPAPTPPTSDPNAPTSDPNAPTTTP